jgi:hypothetical protein
MNASDHQIPSEFLEKNKKFWPEIPNYESSFLVDLLVPDHEFWNVNLITARGLCEVLKAQPEVLIKNKENQNLVKLIESYGIKKIIYLDDFKIFEPHKFKLIIFSMFIWATGITKQRLLNIKYKKSLIGHFIYDDYIGSTGWGTAKIFDLKYAKFIYCALKIFCQYSKIFDSKKYQLYFGAEQTGIWGGVPSAVAVLMGAKVFYRKLGPDKVMYRSYKTEKDLDISPSHIDGLNISELKEKEKQVICWADNYLKNLFSQKVDPIDWPARHAYEKTKEIQAKDILQMGIGKYKYCVFIFCHVFTDAPHTYRQGVFADYQVWLEETLRIVRKRKDALWIVKIHPCEDYFNSKIKADEVCQKFLKYENIKILPNKISPASLLKYMSAIVTVRGTTIVEYSSVGIPVIVAGQGRFSEGNFCIAPESKKEYREVLMKTQFCPLSEEKIKIAKLYLYSIQNMGRIELPLLSDIDLTDLSSFKGPGIINPEKIYNHLIQKLQKTSYQQEMTESYKNYIIKKLSKE